MKKISIIFMAFLALSSVSCDKDFETVNTDPNRATAVPAHLLLGSIIASNQNVVYGMQQGGDMGMCWGQHASKVQYNDEEQYVPRRGSIDAIWNSLYTNVLSDAQSMQALAETEGNTNLQGVALILQANGFQIMTDLYGPIPFTEFNKPGILKPVYDSQEVVYTGILNMLDQAETLLATGTGTIPATSDLVYGGNTAKWRKLANSLKFKALMRISKAKNVSAELQALVNNGQLMSATADSAQLAYISAQPDANPIYETIVFGSRTEYKVSSVLVNKLQSTNDPRLAVYAQKNNAGLYVGNIPGEENPGNYNGFSGFGTHYLRPILPGVILSYAQSQFLLAEAMNEGLVSGGTAGALVAYNNAIRSNFEFNGISGAAAAYIALPNIEFTNKADAKVKIAEQSWFALFGQGFETWTEWRRTGIPALSPVVGAAEASIPSRLYYNSQEISLNRENYTAAAAALTGGDKLTSRLWWMQ